MKAVTFDDVRIEFDREYAMEEEAFDVYLNAFGDR